VGSALSVGQVLLAFGVGHCVWHLFIIFESRKLFSAYHQYAWGVGIRPEAHITVVIMYITCYHSKCCLWKITSMTPHEALFSFSSHQLVHSAVWVSRTLGKNSNVSRRLLQSHLQINVKGKHSDSITHTRIGVRIPVYNIRD